MQLVRGEVVYDIHFTDRWQYHWPMEDGLYDKRKVPDDGWFFLKTMSDGARRRRTGIQRKTHAAHLS